MRYKTHDTKTEPTTETASRESNQRWSSHDMHVAKHGQEKPTNHYSTKLHHNGTPSNGSVKVTFEGWAAVILGSDVEHMLPCAFIVQASLQRNDPLFVPCDNFEQRRAARTYGVDDTQDTVPDFAISARIQVRGTHPANLLWRCAQKKINTISMSSVLILMNPKQVKRKPMRRLAHTTDRAITRTTGIHYSWRPLESQRL